MENSTDEEKQEHHILMRSSVFLRPIEDKNYSAAPKSCRRNINYIKCKNHCMDGGDTCVRVREMTSMWPSLNWSIFALSIVIWRQSGVKTKSLPCISSNSLILRNPAKHNVHVTANRVRTCRSLFSPSPA